jgi:membrane associated rhomboid family serine protease
MFIPLQHENNQGRRWPIISIALVVLNLAVFLGTHWRLEQDSPQRAEVRNHLVILAAMHPELTMPPDAQAFVVSFQKKNPGLWNEIKSENREVADAWDAKMRMVEEPADLQKEMDSLTEQFSALNQNSILDQYAFVPAHPTAISYITANFLHSGWLHLIGNMWFLWLAGAILEDTWGRVIYPLFYLSAGAAALQFYAWLNPDSLTPAIGASGAVAALMGAFLFRFPTTKIEVAVVFGLRSLTNLAMGNGIRFKAAAYWLLPLWLLMEVFSGAAYGSSSGVAHWAHVGGFLFGAAVAVGLRYSGLEHRASTAIEAKVTWTAEPAIVAAAEQMEQGKLDESLATLQTYLATAPDSLEAYSLLPQIYWRKNNIPGFQASTVKRCQLHLKAHNPDAALQDFEEYVNSGGAAMPASTWLELARIFESREDFTRAVSEYDRLADVHSAEKQSILALLAAGRLCLKKLNRPEDALKNYKAAADSQVPHLDWEANIQTGIGNAESALAVGITGPGKK